MRKPTTILIYKIMNMIKFDELFRYRNSKLNVLPLFHSCDVYTFRSIAQSKLLEPSTCDVFSENTMTCVCFVVCMPPEIMAEKNPPSLKPNEKYPHGIFFSSGV